MSATAKDIMDMARKYLGVKESPANSNNVIFNTDYYGHQVSGSNYSWCCAYIWDIFRMAGASGLFYGGNKTAYCPAVQDWGKNNNLTVPKNEGKYGDIALFDWNGNDSADHIGLIEGRYVDGSYRTIEGNTAVGNDSNGGEVMERTRKESDICCIIRPKYATSVTDDEGANAMSKKVYLSPSNQTANDYAYGNTTEAVQCGKIANACKTALERNGVQVMLGQYDSMQNRCDASDKFGADLHVPIHTNAYNGEVSGTRLFCSSFQKDGYKACKAVFNRLAPLTPGTSENIKENYNLFEVKTPSAPTVYIECDFHDVPSIAKWIIENTTTIGETIAHGICDYFGIVFKEAKEESKSSTLYRVQVGAFSVKSNAENMLSDLKKAGFDGFIVQVTK